MTPLLRYVQPAGYSYGAHPGFAVLQNDAVCDFLAANHAGVELIFLVSGFDQDPKYPLLWKTQQQLLISRGVPRCKLVTPEDVAHLDFYAPASDTFTELWLLGHMFRCVLGQHPREIPFSTVCIESHAWRLYMMYQTYAAQVRVHSVTTPGVPRRLGYEFISHLARFMYPKGYGWIFERERHKRGLIHGHIKPAVDSSAWE